MVRAVEKFLSKLKSPKKQKHPFLQGIHTPLRNEYSIEDLEVHGEIPPELDGLYVRNGPNPVKKPKESRYHWFLGDGMVHGVRLKNGSPKWYKNRWVRSYSVSKVLGEAPVEGASREIVDTVNTNVIGFAGKLWALVEGGGCPVELDKDLNTLKHDRFGGTLRGAFSAHPHLDPVSGCLHAICYSVRKHRQLTHVAISPEGEAINEIAIAVKDSPSVHDCAITKNYILILDLPVVFSYKKLLRGGLFPYEWNSNRVARVGVLDRHANKQQDVKWCEVDPCYVFHPCNAYETGRGEIVMDVCAHDSMFASSNFGPDSQSIQFERWFINEASGKFSKQVVDDNPQEFPRINERLTGRYYRFAYSVSLQSSESLGTFVIKHDLETGVWQQHDFGNGRIPGEFVFVPKKSGFSEDDGWLLGFVINVKECATDLVILDAKDFTGSALAEVRIPHIIPPGFHGNWVSDSDFDMEA